MSQMAMRAKDVVDQLEKQHVEIEQAIQDFLPILPQVTDIDTAVKAKKNLAKINKLLDVHLNVEDKLLYPVLKKSPNQTIQNVAKAFSEEMGNLLIDVTEYMDKWSTSPQICLEADDFKRETTALVKVLFNRIERENNELFPLLITG